MWYLQLSILPMAWLSVMNNVFRLYNLNVLQTNNTLKQQTKQQNKLYSVLSFSAVHTAKETQEEINCKWHVQ